MKRPGGGEDTVGVSLFPFLAVLICTMGALIVLLVVISRQARLQAAHSARPTEEAIPVEKLQAALELAEFDVGLLEESRRQTLDQLADQQLRLGSAEAHLRELQQKLRELESAAADLSGAQSASDARRKQLAEEAARLKQQVAEAQRRLDETRRRAEGRPPSYAIVPYRGPHGTHRRPVYVECRHDRVVIQPEGIELAESDFEEPLGPGNPLAAALRAVHDYIAASRADAPAPRQEPYPLLLVRPEGIPAYYRCRKAIRSWGPNFGYEMIEQDWKLKFPPPDVRLAGVLHEAVENARLSQQRLRRAAPRRFADRDRAPFSVRSLQLAGSVEEAVRRRGGNPAEVFGNGAQGDHHDGTGNRHGEPGRHGTGRGPNSDSGHGNDPAGGQNKRGGPSDADTSPYSSLNVSGGTSPHDAGGHAAAAGDGRSSAAGPSQNAAADSPAQNANAAGNQLSPPSPLAEVRGRNWGLPGIDAKSTPITRPIELVLRADRITIRPSERDQRAVVIPLDGPVQRHVDELVAAIWEHIGHWGQAGNQLYWRPILRTEVHPGAERHFADLQRILSGSGLTIEPKRGTTQ